MRRAPRRGEAPVRPSEVSDFRLLYSENCSGCHGANGQGGLTVGIGTPVYLAIADDATIRHVIEEGRSGTAMPAFAQKAGGLLTDAQIDILVRGIRNLGQAGRSWTTRGLRPIRRLQPGDATARPRRIHRLSVLPVTVRTAAAARAITDRFLSRLVSDQHLRTVIITGMPHLGHAGLARVTASHCPMPT